MPIIYRKGNLFDHIREGDCLIHVVNNVGLWGVGFVTPLSVMFPEVRLAYKHWETDVNILPVRITNTGRFKLGENQTVVCTPDRNERKGTFNKPIWIVNMVAQDGVRDGDNPHPLQYTALVDCLRHVERLVPKDKRIICPLIGAGLAGGDWTFISRLIEEIFADRKITVYVLHATDLPPQFRGELWQR